MAKVDDIPLCDVVSVHVDTVDALRPEVRDVAGAGDILALLADDTRFRVLYAVSKSELCVCDVAAVIEATTAVASYHLRLLYRAGLVNYRRKGKLAYYELAGPDIRPLLEAAHDYVRSRDLPSGGSCEPRLPE